jgi:hypothetical protein
VTLREKGLAAGGMGTRGQREDRYMNELLRDAVKWLIGGGALALATFAGTTAYQWGQLEIEREKNLQTFLDKYVEIATKGTLDERIRFALYFDSLQVADKIGVDFARYRSALQNEVATGAEVARMAAEDAGPAPPGGPHVSPPAPAAHGEPAPPGGGPVISPGGPGENGPGEEPLPQPPAQSTQQRVDLTPQQQQEVYYETRKTSVTRLAVPDLERAGIQALLGRDLSLAKSSFDRAIGLWPDYHNLAEIRRLLSDNDDKLGQGDAAAWREVYDTILKRYSWGIPSELLAQLKTAAG